MAHLNWLEAITSALHEEMERDERVFLMGEDVSRNFLGTTKGLVDKFGAERVRDTPIAEAGFVGAGAGAAMVGMRPIVDLMIAPFIYVAFDQVVTSIAKSTYLYGGQAKMPITLRAAMFYERSVAAQHSDRPFSTFMTVPGLKIAVPSSPAEVKGLLKTAIRDDDPVLCFEDSTLMGTAEEVPDGDHLVPFGQAAVKRDGSDVTIVGVGGSVRTALEAAAQLAAQGISAEVIDPRTVVPLDLDTILASVAKTGHLVIADPSPQMGSVASEIGASVAEEGFWDLRAPIARVTTPHVQIPFSPALEANLYPNTERIVAAADSLLS